MNHKTTIAAVLILLAGTGEAAFYKDKVLANVGSGPLGMAVGPDGRAWFTEHGGNRVGAYNRATNSVQEWSLPSADSQPMGIVSGNDGALWFTEYGAGQVGRITTSGQITEFPLASSGGGPSSIAIGPDGNLWVAEYVAGRVARLTPASGATEEYPVGNGPAGITAGPDGNLWVTLYDGNAIVRVTTTGATTTFPLPFAASYPHAICAGADGALWFVQTARNTLGRITTSGAVTEVSLPTPSAGLHGIAATADGSIWYTASALSRVGRRLPTGEIVEYPILKGGASPRGIALVASTIVYVAEQQSNSIGTFDLGDPLTLFSVPGPNPGATGGIAANGDGDLWFGISDTEFGRVSQTGAMLRLPLSPGLAFGSYSRRCFRTGPNGNVWFPYGSSSYGGAGVGEIDGGGIVTTHPVPERPQSLAFDSSGNTWFSMPGSGFGLGRLDPMAGSVAYPVTVREGSSALTLGPGGDLWFISSASSFGRMTTAGQATYGAVPGSYYDSPAAITMGSDGNIWFTRSSYSLGRMTPMFIVTEVQTTSGVGGEIVTGSDGNLWTTTGKGLLRVTPDLQTTYFDFGFSGYGSQFSGLAPGPDGAIWFTESSFKIVGRFALEALQPSRFHTLAPCRILDTRDPVGPFGGPAVAAHSTRVITVTGTCNIPADAVAISANVTVVPGSGGGFLRVYPGDAGPSITTTVAFPPGVVRASSTMAGLAGDGTGRLGILNDSGDAVHVIVDVNGVFR